MKLMLCIIIITYFILPISYGIHQLTETDYIKKPDNDVESPRIIYLGTTNYTVSFVPLITLIANLIPRISNRLSSGNNQTPFPSMSKRVSEESRDDSFKKKIYCEDKKIGQWGLPKQTCGFFDCKFINPLPDDCLDQTFQLRNIINVSKRNSKKMYQLIINECVLQTVYKCINGTAYNFRSKQCTKRYQNSNNCDNNDL